MQSSLCAAAVVPPVIPGLPGGRQQLAAVEAIFFCASGIEESHRVLPSGFMLHSLLDWQARATATIVRGLRVTAIRTPRTG
jgi:hypothetical protein